MSNYNYEKYIELVSHMESVLEKLKSIDENNYKEEVVEKACRNLISTSNSLMMYIRHSKNK